MAWTTTRTRAALENVVSIVEGTTPDNTWAGTKRFKHIDRAQLDSVRTARDASRLFVVDLVGDRVLAGDMLTTREPGTVEQTVELQIVYPLSDSPWDLARIIAEDVDRLAFRLMLASLYDQANTGIWRRRVDGYSIDEPDQQGGVATVTVPVALQYRPNFSG